MCSPPSAGANRRPEPRSTRDHDANVLQPALLANSTLGPPPHAPQRRARLHRARAGGAAGRRNSSRELFLRLLSRPPTPAELRNSPRSSRPALPRAAPALRRAPPRPPFTKAVSWANHLNGDATTVVLAVEKEVKAGDPPTAAPRERLARADGRRALGAHAFTGIHPTSHEPVPLPPRVHHARHARRRRAAALGAPLFAEDQKAPLGKAEHCLFIWLGGGMSQIDTFDAKPTKGDPAKKAGLLLRHASTPRSPACRSASICRGSRRCRTGSCPCAR